MTRKFVRRIRSPVLCMRTNQPNQRPPNHKHDARQLDTSLAFLASFSWWEDISFICEDGGFTRARAQSFGKSFSAVPAMLLGPTEARSQSRARRAHCFSRQSDDHEGRPAS